MGGGGGATLKFRKLGGGDLKIYKIAIFLFIFAFHAIYIFYKKNCYWAGSKILGGGGDSEIFYFCDQI